MYYLPALIMVLFNTAKNTWHPIFYFESPMPGGPDNNEKLIRYKSKGHHTSGFEARELAISECERVEKRLVDGGCPLVTMEIEKDEQWDGEGVPADVQIRHRKVETI